MDVC
jgi:hypothetical protein